MNNGAVSDCAVDNGTNKLEGTDNFRAYNFGDTNDGAWNLGGFYYRASNDGASDNEDSSHHM